MESVGGIVNNVFLRIKKKNKDKWRDVRNLSFGSAESPDTRVVKCGMYRHCPCEGEENEMRKSIIKEIEQNIKKNNKGVWVIHLEPCRLFSSNNLNPRWAKLAKICALTGSRVVRHTTVVIHLIGGKKKWLKKRNDKNREWYSELKKEKRKRKESVTLTWRWLGQCTWWCWGTVWTCLPSPLERKEVRVN